MNGITYEAGKGILTEQEIDDAVWTCEFWKGTPWKNRMETHGLGIDCLHLMKVVFTRAKILPEYRLPYYHYAMGLRATFNIMETVFSTCCDVDILDPSESTTDGDVIVFACGDVSNHVGMIFGGRLWEARARHRVCGFAAGETSLERVQSVLRLKSREFKVKPETLNIRKIAQ